MCECQQIYARATPFISESLSLSRVVNENAQRVRYTCRWTVIFAARYGSRACHVHSFPHRPIMSLFLPTHFCCYLGEPDTCTFVLLPWKASFENPVTCDEALCRPEINSLAPFPVTRSCHIRYLSEISDERRGRDDFERSSRRSSTRGVSLHHTQSEPKGKKNHAVSRQTWKALETHKCRLAILAL